MNVFMPKSSISESVQALDDLRLRKQILECKQIYDLITNPKNPNSPYLNHPIVKHYANFPSIIIMYGFACAREYILRFRKYHAYTSFFTDLQRKLESELNDIHSNIDELEQSFKDSFIYVENVRITNNKVVQIREYSQERVNALFQEKLYEKWLDSKHKSTWSNREVPEFLKLYRSEENSKLIDTIIQHNTVRNVCLIHKLL